MSTAAVSGSHAPNTAVAIHAWNNNGSIITYTTKALSWATIGYGMDATQSRNYYIAVQRVQIDKNRQK